MKQRGGPRPGSGPKPFAPTGEERAQVRRLSQEEGVPYDQIAPQVRDGISLPTLVKHFKAELTPCRPGPKPFNPTADERRLVEMLAGWGIRQEGIAAALRGGVGKNTIWRYFREEIHRGRMVANLKVAETLYEKAVVDKDVTALIWWTKARMGWRAAWDGPKDRHPEPVPVERIERMIVPTSGAPT